MVIRASGHIDADRADKLWDAIEYAFESEPGRRVVLDVTDLSGFEPAGLGELVNSVRVAVRRRDDLRLVDPHSVLTRYLHTDIPTGASSIYHAVSDALA